MRSREEDQVQAGIVEFLDMLGILVFHVPNGGGRSKIEGAILKGLGVKPGIPDLIVVREDGRMICIECKRPKRRLLTGELSKASARLSESQKEMIPKLAKLGVPTIIAESLDDALRGLTDLDVIPRRSTFSQRL